MPKKNDDAFKLKANFFPITVIQFTRLDFPLILQQLKNIQTTAPHYFHQSPLVLDFGVLKRTVKSIDLPGLCELLRQHQMIPVGILGLLPDEENLAALVDVPLWKGNMRQETKKNEVKNEKNPVVKKNTNLVIHKPVRSGMRVYAKESNLVILSPVSSGAECIAEGSIFCYAPVRGRLLAGADGNAQAEIFCQDLEAELISIAGYYVIDGDYPEERKGSFHIRLKDSKVVITNFSLERERSVLCQR
jgi:septum site-determining protein MinC